MKEKMSKLWETEKKLVLLFGVGGIFAVIIFILFIVILINIFKTYKYNEIENILVESTQKYLKQNTSLFPANGENLEVTSEMLISGKFMKEFKRLTKDTNCSGVVMVSNTSGVARLTPILTCDNYHTITLSQKVLENESIVPSQEGLYQMNDMYVYRGEYLNNYINFAGFSWRIYKFDNEKVYIILSDTTNPKNLYVYDDRYNETAGNNRGKNNFENSRISLSLKNIYLNDFKNYHQYMLPIEACIHERGELDQNNTGAIECMTTTNVNFSMLSLFDYINASIDPLCKSSSSQNCSNYNFLAKAKNKWWLLNGTNENTYEVYGIDTLGRISLEWAAAKKDVRPVVALPSDLVYKSGDGTSGNPYTFYEY